MLADGGVQLPGHAELRPLNPRADLELLPGTASLLLAWPQLACVRSSCAGGGADVLELFPKFKNPNFRCGEPQPPQLQPKPKVGNGRRGHGGRGRGCKLWLWILAAGHDHRLAVFAGWLWPRSGH